MENESVIRSRIHGDLHSLGGKFVLLASGTLVWNAIYVSTNSSHFVMVMNDFLWKCILKLIPALAADAIFCEAINANETQDSVISNCTGGR